MVSKFVGIMLGIAIANCIQSSTSLSLASFGVITWIHMFCNLKSYQSIQLRTLNPYRASTYLLSLSVVDIVYIVLHNWYIGLVLSSFCLGINGENLLSASCFAQTLTVDSQVSKFVLSC